MENFFRRVESYTEVPPTDAMTDIIVKIMVEVLNIFAIATTEMKQGRASMLLCRDVRSLANVCSAKYFKKLAGKRDMEDTGERLDRLTQEEARMAAAQILKLTHGVDNKVKVVDDSDKVTGISNNVKDVDDKINIVLNGTLNTFATQNPTLNCAYFCQMEILLKQSFSKPQIA